MMSAGNGLRWRRCSWTDERGERCGRWFRSRGTGYCPEHFAAYMRNWRARRRAQLERLRSLEREVKTSNGGEINDT